MTTRTLEFSSKQFRNGKTETDKILKRRKKIEERLVVWMSSRKLSHCKPSHNHTNKLSQFQFYHGVDQKDCWLKLNPCEILFCLPKRQWSEQCFGRSMERNSRKLKCSLKCLCWKCIALHTAVSSQDGASRWWCLVS